MPPEKRRIISGLSGIHSDMEIPTVVKTAVELLGYPVGKCRSPFHQIPREGVEAIKQVLKDCREAGIR